MNTPNHKEKTVVMTEQMIVGYLKNNRANRPLKRSGVKYLERTITEKGWLNSMPFHVTESGWLIDGQTRLNALNNLKMFDKTCSLWVYKDSDVTPELRASFNTGIRGTVPDVMQMIYGWEDARRKCTTYTQAFLACTLGYNGYDKLSKITEDIAIACDLVFRDSFSMLPSQPKKGHSLQPSFYTAAMFALKEHPEAQNKLTNLAASVNSGFGITPRSAESAFVVYKNYLHDNDSTKNRIGQVLAYYAAIDAFVHGKRVAEIGKRQDLIEWAKQKLKTFGDEINYNL